MDDLIQLIKVISIQKVKQIEIISESKGKENKYTQLYHAIREGKVKSDEEGHQLLYPNTNDKTSYKRFRNRFKNRLYNTLFFIDLNQPNFNDHRKAKFEINKLWCICQMLYERQLNKKQYTFTKRYFHLH